MRGKLLILRGPPPYFVERRARPSQSETTSLTYRLYAPRGTSSRPSSRRRRTWRFSRCRGSAPAPRFHQYASRCCGGGPRVLGGRTRRPLPRPWRCRRSLHCFSPAGVLQNGFVRQRKHYRPPQCSSLFCPAVAYSSARRCVYRRTVYRSVAGCSDLCNGCAHRLHCPSKQQHPSAAAARLRLPKGISG